MSSQVRRLSNDIVAGWNITKHRNNGWLGLPYCSVRPWNCYVRRQRVMIISSAATITHDEPNMSIEPGNPFALIDVLLRHEVVMAIIGGYAVIYHGHVRATEDVDVIFDRSRPNEQALLAALTELEAFWISNEIDPETGIEKVYPVTHDYVIRTHLMMLGTKFGYLDIFDFVPKLPDAVPRQLIDEAEHSEGRPFVSLPWLRRMKQASRRPKDQEDLRHLRT